MNNSSQAPKGGMTSQINGQWYDGGEFMPVHGLFCGKKGAKRLVKWEKAEKQGNAKNLGGSKLYEVTEYVGGGISNILGYAIADTHKQAEAAFTAKTKTYAKEI